MSAIIGALLMSGRTFGRDTISFQGQQFENTALRRSIVDSHKKKGGPAHRVSTGIAKAKRDATKRKNVQRNKAHH